MHDCEAENSNYRSRSKINKDENGERFSPLTDGINELNNPHIDNAKNFDIFMSMYNLMEYRNNYSKTWGCLWQYCRDEPNTTLKKSESFKPKAEITERTPYNGNTQNIEIAVSLEFLSNFLRTLEMPIITAKLISF